VHGGWGGGWALRPLQRDLEARGLTVYRPSLLGTGETAHVDPSGVGLDSHVQQIVNLIEYEDLRDVVLIGHSYAGMVITGVVDRIPERIRQVVYLDAFLPRDGESTMTFAAQMTSEFSRTLLAQIERDAASGAVRAFWVKPDAVPPKQDPQPAHTLTDRITLSNPRAAFVPGAFIQFVPPGTASERADFGWAAARARERGWPVRVLAAEHGAPAFQPDRVAEAIVDVLEKRVDAPARGAAAVAGTPPR
jgi:pimeloyl-ACP methyl ester carboxylesterase